MSPIDHIIVYFLFFFTLFLFVLVSGKARNPKPFFRVLGLFCIVFVLVEGCRYGRGTDYLSYANRYLHIDADSETQFLFLWYMKFLKSLQFTVPMYFMANSVTFLVGVTYFVRNSYEGDNVRWILFFSIFALLHHFENEIRQYLAFPFLLIALSNYINARSKIDVLISFAWIMVVAMIHTGLLFCVPFLLLSFHIKKEIPLYVSVSLLIAAYYIIPQGFFSGSFVDVLNQMFLLSGASGEDTFYAHYVEDSERWLGDSSVIEGAMQTPLTIFLQFLFELGIIIASFISLKQKPNQKVLFLFNLFVISAFFDRVMFGYEIIQRMTRQLYIFWFVPVGYAFSLYPQLKGIKRHVVFASFVLLVLYLVAFWSRFVFLYPDADYVWNH